MVESGRRVHLGVEKRTEEIVHGPHLYPCVEIFIFMILSRIGSHIVMNFLNILWITFDTLRFHFLWGPCCRSCYNCINFNINSDSFHFPLFQSKLRCLFSDVSFTTSFVFFCTHPEYGAHCDTFTNHYPPC